MGFYNILILLIRQQADKFSLCSSIILLAQSCWFLQVITDAFLPKYIFHQILSYYFNLVFETHTRSVCLFFFTFSYVNNHARVTKQLDETWRFLPLHNSHLKRNFSINERFLNEKICAQRIGTKSTSFIHNY